jgi:deoxyguanosine kinase
MRIAVAGSGAGQYVIPEYCSLTHVVVQNGPWPRTADGMPAWPVLADCELLWVEQPLASAALDATLAAASACQVPIYAAVEAPTTVPGVRVRPAASLTAAIENFEVDLIPSTPSTGLARLQHYYARMSQVRGYGTSKPLEALLLLTEEVGELAHAIRKHTKMDRTRPFAVELNVAEELADVQLFLLTLANTLEVDLAGAVREKERVNHQRAVARFAPDARPNIASFVAIEGLIGAGKTTAARHVAATLGLEPVLERVESHPFIEAFYADGLAHALELELAFILMRWHDIRRAGVNQTVIADFSPFKDIVFSQMLLNDHADLDLVHRTYAELWTKERQPDLTIFLEVSPNVALERIVARDRSFERGIDLSYLTRLDQAYHQNVERLGERVVRIQVSAEDSEHDVADQILAIIERHGGAASTTAI